MRIGNTRVISPQEKDLRLQCCRLISIVLFILCGISLFYRESHWKQKTIAVDELLPLIKTQEMNNDNVNINENPIHFTTTMISPEEELTDEAFGIFKKTGLRLKRRIEYCQWQEFEVSNIFDDEDDSVTYYYVKGWHDRMISSVFFDQWATHYNPYYVSLDSKTITSPAKLGKYHASEEMIQMLGRFKKVKSFEKEELIQFKHSAAHEEGFVYVGDGYFYLAFSESLSVTLLKTFGQILEGTLLDYQLGDLLSVCTAGDVRVSYEIANPEVVSVIGKQSSNIQGSPIIEPWISSKGFKFALIQEGEWTAEQMLTRHLRSERFTLYMFRIGFIILSFVTLFLFVFDLSATFILSQVLNMSYFFGIWAYLYDQRNNHGYVIVISLCLVFLYYRCRTYSAKDCCKDE